MLAYIKCVMRKKSNNYHDNDFRRPQRAFIQHSDRKICKTSIEEKNSA